MESVVVFEAMTMDQLSSHFRFCPACLFPLLHCHFCHASVQWPQASEVYSYQSLKPLKALRAPQSVDASTYSGRGDMRFTGYLHLDPNSASSTSSYYNTPSTPPVWKTSTRSSGTSG
jgi:hypothetical protein